MKPNITKPGATTRKTITLSQETLVRESFLSDGGSLPLVFQPAVDGLSLSHWTKRNHDLIKERLSRSGAILFRGFNLSTVAEFEEFMSILAGDLLDYAYRSTPRTQLSGKIFTSTEYPAHQTIPLHNELSYMRQWPMVIGFFCIEPALEGGETPLVDSRAVFDRIDPMIRERFSRKRVMYVRNYREGLDLSWQNVFQTESRNTVEEFCRKAEIEFEWKGEDRLRTSQVCQGVANHPRTGELVWFNQAHLFHVSSLKTELRESLLASANGEPPRNAFYGDGSPLIDADLDQIREAYNSQAIVIAWRRNDILVCDNMLVAHGRRPFRGERKIAVSMGQPYAAG